MTTIRATSAISDTIQLVKDSGETLEFKFSFVPSVTLIKRIRALQVAQIEAQKQPDDAKTAAIGSVVIDLFALIFGKQNTENILAFYGKNYDIMLMDIFPYIRDEIIPKVQQSAQNAKRATRAKYRR